MLEIDALRLRVGGILVLDGIDLCARQGEVIGLVGANGSGKTTLLDVLCGLTRADAGRALLDGTELIGRAPHEIARLGTARGFQRVRVQERQSVLDNVAARASVHVAMPWIERVGLATKATMLAGELSSLDRRRLELARIGAAQARLMLLDEPAAGLDRGGHAVVIDLVRAGVDRGAICLVVEHRLDLLASVADRILRMRDGRISEEIATT